MQIMTVRELFDFVVSDICMIKEKLQVEVQTTCEDDILNAYLDMVICAFNFLF